MLPVIVALLAARTQRMEFAYRMAKKHRCKGVHKMNQEVIKNFIGKECLIYMMNSQIAGTIEALNDNWLSVKVGDNVDIINVDYIGRIREYPVGKNGKKRSVVLD